MLTTHDPILVKKYQFYMVKKGLLSCHGPCFCTQNLCITKTLSNVGLYLVAQKALDIFVQLPLLYHKLFKVIYPSSLIFGLYFCKYYY